MPQGDFVLLLIITLAAVLLIIFFVTREPSGKKRRTDQNDELWFDRPCQYVGPTTSVNHAAPSTISYDKRADAERYGTVINPNTTSWAYPDEILPVESIVLGKDSAAFKDELDARYALVQKRHRDNISAIHAPGADHIVPIHHSSLNPAEIIFLWYMNGKPTNNPKIGVYWRLNYGISNYQAQISKLVKGGLLSVSNDPQSYLSRLTIAKLSEICDAHGIPKTGKKQDLITILSLNLPASILDNIMKEHATFVLTSSGELAIKENPELIMCHRYRSYLGPNNDLRSIQRSVKSRPNDDMLMAILEASGQPRDIARRISKYYGPKSAASTKQRAAAGALNAVKHR